MKKFIIILFIAAVSLNAQSEFKVEAKFIGGAEKFGEMNSVRYTVSNKNSVLYSIERTIAYDEPEPQVLVFDEGSSVIIRALTAKLEFISPEGLSIAEICADPETEVEYERTLFADTFGDELAVAVNNPRFENYTKVIVLNSKGNKITENNISPELTDAVKFIKKNLFAVSGYGWSNNKLTETTKIFNSEIQNITEFNSRFTSSELKNNMFLGWTNKSVFLFNIEQNRVNFVKKYVNNELIAGAEFGKNLIVLRTTSDDAIASGKSIYQNTKEIKLDFKGKQIN